MTDQTLSFFHVAAASDRFFLVHHKSEVKGVFRTALQMCLSHKMGK